MSNIPLTDDRVQEIADLTGADAADVLTFAEDLSAVNGDSVSDELDEGVAEVEAAADDGDIDTLGDAGEFIAEHARTAALLDGTAGL